MADDRGNDDDNDDDDEWGPPVSSGSTRRQQLADRQMGASPMPMPMPGHHGGTAAGVGGINSPPWESSPPALGARAAVREEDFDDEMSFGLGMSGAAAGAVGVVDRVGVGAAEGGPGLFRSANGAAADASAAVRSTGVSWFARPSSRTARGAQEVFTVYALRFGKISSSVYKCNAM